MTDSQTEVLAVSRRVRIPLDEFTFTYVRSSGPGGQNVNKVSTKARLEWDVVASPSLPDDVRERFLQRYRRRISSAGVLGITSQRYRDRSRNVDDCLEKLRALLTEVLAAPKPRKKTRPTRGSQERRLAEKRRRSQRKQSRGRPSADD